MEKDSYKKLRRYLINMGKRGRLWRIPAVAGLAVSMFGYRLCAHCRRQTGRFVCAAFILCCFIIGSSFDFPVFHEEGGFVSAKEKNTNDMLYSSQYEALKGQGESAKGQKAGEDNATADIAGESIPLSKDIKDLDDNKNENKTGSPSETAKKETKEKEQVQFDSGDWKLILINKQHPIPEDYSFSLGPIKTMKGTMKCDERIIEDLLDMIDAAKDDEINLAICSPYRDMNWQKVLFERKIKAYMAKDMTYMEAYKAASQTVTVPGASEHEVGISLDIVADTYYTLDEGFAETEAGMWLAGHCAEYGFILRYPEGKEHITGIEFEPWHFRYVGKDAAKVIMDEELCLEEFWEKYLQ